MELDNLFSKLSSPEEKKEYFLALEIAPQHVLSAVWQTEKDKVKVISLGSRGRWDGKTLESLIAATDNSLAAALEKLPEEPNKIIFGLPETWVSENKIVPPRLAELKSLCQKLDLQPLGFVVTTEAVIQYLKSVEGTPFSGILLRLQKEATLLTLVKAGKNLGTQAVGRSEDLGADVYEGLARFGQEEVFPSRIILYDSDEVDLEGVKQRLLNFDWKKSLFLHFPKVEILENEVSIQAVAIAGGEEVAESLGLKQEPAVGDFGFVKGKDVIEEKKPERPVKEEPIAEEGKEQSPPKRKLSLPKLKLPKLKLKLPRLRLKLPRLASQKRLPLIIGLIGLGLLILAGAATAFYWSAPKAQVKIFVEAKPLEKEFEINLDPDLAVLNVDKKQIPGEVVEVEISESQEKAASGEKMIGEEAKGEVTIHNFTTGSKSFKKGTVIVGPDGLEFDLDVDVTVASASSSFDEDWREVISPGKTKVVATALEVGPDYNLASESEFEVKGFAPSSYRAKNEKAFSGGTSRQVKVVSAEDREELLSELTTILEEKVKEELRKKMPEDKEILEEAILTSITKREFDHAVGTEADTLKLETTMKAKTFAYSPADLEVLLRELITDSVPADFILKKLEVETKNRQATEEGKATFGVSLKASLVPDLNLEKIKDNLTGKYPQVGDEYLHSLPNFVRAEVTITPKLVPRLQTFPRLTKNIDIQVETKD